MFGLGLSGFLNVLTLKFFGITTCCNNYVCYTTLMALKVRDTCLWYLDGGCSKHMTGNEALF